MSDNSSAYPGALDPTPVVLENEVDFIPLDALKFVLSMISAIQGEVGNDPVRFVSQGAFDYGTIAAFMLALCRVETGEHATLGLNFRVDFTANRFTKPPIVLIQEKKASSPGGNSVYNALDVTTDGFRVGSGHATKTLANVTVWWMAIEVPFALEVQ